MGELQQPRNKNDPPFRQTMITVIANNYKSSANGSKSIIRKNLGSNKRSEINLIQNFEKHYHGSNGKRHDGIKDGGVQAAHVNIQTLTPSQVPTLCSKK